MSGAVQQGVALDPEHVRAVADDLDASSGRVRVIVGSLDGRVFGPDAAGRNYRVEVAALSDGVGMLAATLGRWSDAIDATSTAIVRGVEASVRTDGAVAESVTDRGPA